MALHLSFIKKMSKKSTRQLDYELNIQHNKSGPRLICVREKSTELNGESFVIRRLYVEAKDTNVLSSVGWVSNENILKCMLCFKDFGFVKRRHHCRACGNLVCYKCSGNRTPLIGIENMGPLRVCIECCSKEKAHRNIAVPVYCTDDWGKIVNFRSTETGPIKVQSSLREVPIIASAPISVSVAIKTCDSLCDSTSDSASLTSLSGSLKSTFFCSNHSSNCPLDITIAMFEVSKHRIVPADSAAELVKQASSDPSVLLGWLILLQHESNLVAEIQSIERADVYLINRIRKNHLRKTEFQLCHRYSNGTGCNFWTLLKRTGKKHGLLFAPLYQVLYVDECVTSDAPSDTVDAVIHEEACDNGDVCVDSSFGNFDAMGVDRQTIHGFFVRGKNYLVDKKKVHPGAALFKFVNLEVYEVEKLSQSSPELCFDRHDHISSRGQAKLKRESIANQFGSSFQIIVNLQIPGDPPVSIVQYFVVTSSALDSIHEGFRKIFNEFIDIPVDESDRLRLWEQLGPAKSFFLTDVKWPCANELGALPREDKRHSRFKIIPAISEGPWVVKSAVGNKPTLLGKKVACRYFRGSDYLEIDVHVGSSSIASNIVGVCRSAAKYFVAELAYVLEGNDSDELPEQVLGACALVNIDLSQRVKLQDEMITN